MSAVCRFALVLALLVVGCGGVEPVSEPPPGDMAARGAADGGVDGGNTGALKPFGSPCAANGECASNICFIGGNRTFCSLHCTMATARMDCPVPPTSGACNMQGYCKP